MPGVRDLAEYASNPSSFRTVSNKKAIKAGNVAHSRIGKHKAKVLLIAAMVLLSVLLAMQGLDLWKFL